MKKLRLFVFLALITMLTLLILVGCEKEDGVASISLKDHDPSTAIEVAVGDFDFNTYTLVVVYELGNTEEIALTEEMIEEKDLFKLYQIGEHEITINYEKQAYTFTVSIKRATFGELFFPENNVFTYDGEEHTVEVDGNIPANAVVTYLGGNSFVNVGTYDITAVISCEGYVTEKLETTVTINPATYDMSGVKFEGKEVVYDGTAHSVAISGTLPEGVPTPTYTINGKAASSATDVGEYTVKATFANTDSNYEAIPEMEAVLKITPAEYTVKGVDIAFKDENGKILHDATKIYDGKSVTFDVNDYNKLSKKVSVSFSVYDKDGKVISTSNKKTGILNAGIYTIKMEFVHSDGKNYSTIEPITRTFEVLKTEYPPLTNVELVSGQATYDGNAHSLHIDEKKLPQGVTVSYEYYRNGELVLDKDGKPVEQVTNAGRYTVKAVFSHDDPNCKEIKSISATLLIEPAQISFLNFAFDYESSWVYDGTPKSVTTIRKPDYTEVAFEYYENGDLITEADGVTPVSSVTKTGTYSVKVMVYVTNNNYVPMEPIYLSFSIVPPSN